MEAQERRVKPLHTTSQILVHRRVAAECARPVQTAVGLLSIPVPSLQGQAIWRNPQSIVATVCPGLQQHWNLTCQQGLGKFLNTRGSQVTDDYKSTQASNILATNSHQLLSSKEVPAKERELMQQKHDAQDSDVLKVCLARIPSRIGKPMVTISFEGYSKIPQKNVFSHGHKQMSPSCSISG